MKEEDGKLWTDRINDYRSCGLTVYNDLKIKVLLFIVSGIIYTNLIKKGNKNLVKYNGYL